MTQRHAADISRRENDRVSARQLSRIGGYWVEGRFYQALSDDLGWSQREDQVKAYGVQRTN